METRELNSLTLFHRGIHEASNNAKWRESPSAEWEAGVNASRAASLPTTIKVGWLMVGPTLFVALYYRSIGHHCGAQSSLSLHLLYYEC